MTPQSNNKSNKTARKSKKKPIDMSSQPQPTKGGPPIVSSPLVEVRNSPVHGRGVFAVAPIKKGTRILEYLGDRISHEAADARYEDHDENDNHTFLFIVDKQTVIDAGVGGNDARFINHQCEGNCESVIENRRVFIDAARDIAPGQELGYDYEIGREKDDPPNVDEIYACRCGSEKCRGTMLWPPKKETSTRRKKSPRLTEARKSRRPQSPKRTRTRGERPRRRA
jgi:SET domain-containing protein